ncbi:Bug family tripartite tricarboxylate transporter substrate binding protein [Bordetella genomosp. 9]|uniref:Tricarboxylate-binding receptor n=1 Tax=Bordetella genomosp. 9 TaxID=1416803 RepID=A0A1W6YWH4_9BORD|nr:tripartite tricarboxylate transporter substrate binding protein [Bordetella genomosp. 9]ARP85351.1 tricarboxylate-binding receptor [Bordetella genomosp. 9]ARP89334.1 tricarboxylate-binding receptor [Bordetella genomosp. 9]
MKPRLSNALHTALAATPLALAMIAAAPSAQAAPYPCQNLKIVSPYPPGGTTDILARLIAPSLQGDLGVPVIVENRGGASSNIGTEYVARAEPDGCTVLLGNNTGIVINRNLYKLRLDPVEALRPVAEVAAMPLVLYVNPKVPAKTLPELVGLLQKSGTYSFASGGSGSPQHLAGELFRLATGADLLHIPYKGQGPAMMDVVGGQVQMAFETTAALSPQAKAGRVVPLATTGATRAAGFTDIPTMTEAGFKNFVITNWYGVFAPAGTPPALVTQLHAAVAKALANPEVAGKLAELGSEKVGGSPEEFAAFVASEVPRWEEVVKRSNAKVD